MNTKSFFLASILLVASALQSSARGTVVGGNPTTPPVEVSKGGVSKGG